MKKYLLNAFSAQMLAGNACVNFEEINSLPGNLISAIGHPDTAAVLGVQPNRINVQLNEKDVCYIAQLQGGRLPEGATTLPEGYSFKYLKAEVTKPIKALLYIALEPSSQPLDWAGAIPITNTREEILSRIKVGCSIQFGGHSGIVTSITNRPNEDFYYKSSDGDKYRISIENIDNIVEVNLSE